MRTPTVRTVPKGTLVGNSVLGTQGEPLTREQAEAWAAGCNKQAEEMGLEVRYEVTNK